MPDYSNYEAEDFILDDSFIEWVLNDSEEHALFWDIWLLNHPERKNIIEHARQIVQAIEIKFQEGITDSEVNQIIDHLNEKKTIQALSPYSKPASYKFWLSLAAIFFILITSGILTYKFSRSENFKQIIPVSQSILLKKLNETQQPILIRLTDGTSAILKPGSVLYYPKSFPDNIREVYLKGEAFFEVAKNPLKPFLVHSGEMITRVVGTSFTVKAYEKNNEFQVIVNTGRVTVYKENETALKDAIILVPNQKAVFNREKVYFIKEILPEPLMLSKEVSDEKFTFYESPLSKVIDRLKEAYDVKINYDEKTLGGCPLTASLSDQPLYEKLGLICNALNAHFSVNDGYIQISGNGCSTLNKSDQTNNTNP